MGKGLTAAAGASVLDPEPASTGDCAVVGEPLDSGDG